MLTHEAPTRDELNRYLEAYCAVVGTEELRLPLVAGDGEIEPPQSYLAHKPKISEHLEAEKDREIGDVTTNEPENGDGGELLEGDGLKPLD